MADWQHSRILMPLRLGHEIPRIFTPPLRELTEETSLGFDVIKFSEQIIGVTLHPWESWLFIHALELRPDRSFRFRTIVILVARQNGKSTWSRLLALYFMYVLGVALILGTAQDLDTAEEVWDGALEIIEDTPELKELAEKPILRNGKKTIRLKTGERYKVKAATRRSGRGLSGDLVMLDELREHQSWDAWGAITKTTMARPNALIAALSNAGDATSVVLRYLRKMAHATLGDPDGINAADDPASLLALEADSEDLEIEADDSLGIFEWSAPPGCGIWDRDGWAQANPSMGYTIQERTIASSAHTDPEWVFRTEVLCQWSDGSLEGPFPAGSWEEGISPGSKIVGQVSACVDISADQTKAHIAFAGHTADGEPQVEIVASRAGSGWVEDWLLDPQRRDRITGVAAQGRGAPVSGLIADWEAAGIPMVEWQGSDLATGTAGFYNLVRSGGLRHLVQPVLDVAAAVAVSKPAGDGLFLWDRRKSAVDIAPLVAATGAVWLLTRGTATPFVSVYESRGLVVL